ncbi:MAG: hypothetical protein ACI9OJ_000600 [Myxococcota bacterium]
MRARSAPARCLRVGVIVLLGLATAVPQASAGSKGNLALETRAFWPDDDDLTTDYGISLAGQVQFSWKSKQWRLTLGAFGRVGALEIDRSILFAEDAFVAFRSKWVRIRIGTQVVNWSATEAFHPADVMNSRNFDSNIENAEKLGEPMVAINLRLWEGARLEGFYMPFRLSPNLPNPSSRLSFAPTTVDAAPAFTGAQVAVGDTQWVDRDGGISTGLVSHQWGARFSQTLDGADISLQVLQHNDRNQPSFTAPLAGLPGQGSAGGALEMQPVYHFVTHAGLTYTHVIEDWVVKVEAAYRHFHDVDDSAMAQFAPFLSIEQKDHVQVAAGLEYGWVYDNDHEATLILEGQAFIWYDGRPGDGDAEGPFENDVLIGYRHAFNDEAGTEFLFTLISDVLTWPEILVGLQYSQRLNEVWGIKAGVRLSFAEPEGTFPSNLQPLHNDHNVNLSLTRYF